MSRTRAEIVKLYDELINALMKNIGSEVKYVWGSHKATIEGLRVIVSRRMKLQKSDIMINPDMIEVLKLINE
jgi:hypothetical protein|tara:strand:+ start:1472 stop:1687 length:216 start_codon:yes stop_codon:yes gene_type:complete